MSWLQLILPTTNALAAKAEDALFDVEALTVTLEDLADQPILEPGVGETPLWLNTRIVALFPVSVDTTVVDQQLTASLGPEYVWRWELLEDRDWEREWMKHFQPIQCGERLWICPSWKSPPNKDAVNLLLDPGLAFGTGTHPTTFLCLQWLDSLDLSGLNVVDYGCGSGILAIAALLLGAHHATCVDNDPQALLATLDNAKRNNLAETKVDVCLPDDLSRGQHDVVCANILAGPLLELREVIAAQVKPQGRLCLSGIIAAQAKQLMDAYAQWFDFDEPVFQEDWVRLTATKHR